MRRVNGLDHAQVGAFHENFGLPCVFGSRLPDPRHVPPDVAAFRVKFLKEEVEELEAAYAEHDLPGVADALVDLVYVALGTAHLHGLPWGDLFDTVHAANMRKRRCTLGHAYLPCRDANHATEHCAQRDLTGKECGRPEREHSRRGSALDVIKPHDWEPPDLVAVLLKHGWRP
jgi:hypothetical protein